MANILGHNLINVENVLRNVNYVSTIFNVVNVSRVFILFQMANVNKYVVIVMYMYLSVMMEINLMVMDVLHNVKYKMVTNVIEISRISVYKKE